MFFMLICSYSTTLNSKIIVLTNISCLWLLQPCSPLTFLSASPLIPSYHNYKKCRIQFQPIFHLVRIRIVITLDFFGVFMKRGKMVLKIVYFLFLGSGNAIWLNVLTFKFKYDEMYIISKASPAHNANGNVWDTVRAVTSKREPFRLKFKIA